MDKKKSRTDLLAAGRQKLQQFRQKKDNRGIDQKKDTKGSTSQGKSSKKSGKSEQHEPNSDTNAFAAEAAVPWQVVEGGIHSQKDFGQEVVDSLETCSEKELAHEVDASVSGPSSELAVPEQGNTRATSEQEAELRQQVAASENVADLSLLSERENSQSISTEGVSTMDSSTSESTDSKTGIKHADAPADIGCFGSPALGDPVAGAGVGVESVPGSGENAQHTSSLHEDIPDISLICARRDQEDDGSHTQQFSESFEKADVEKTGSEAGKTSNAANVYTSSSVSHFSEGSPISLALHEAEGLNTKTRQIRDAADLPKEKTETSSGPGICCNNRNEVLSVEPGESNVADMSSKQDLPEGIGMSGEVTASHVLDGRSISFLQLIDIVRGLGEDEYEVLCKSRELACSEEVGTSLLDRVKEELFVSSSMKDILLVQLREQSNLQNEFDQQRCQLLTEISQLHASFSAVKDRNDFLAEELLDCRSKLYAATSSNERLENQLLDTVAQVGDFAAKKNELQLNLEKSQLELSEAKDLLINLQVENETLGAIISSVNDEKKKLLEEKESKDYEIKQLLSELSNCKNLVVSLQAEIDKLDKTIGPLTDEKMKLVEEKDNLLGEVEKLQAELVGCKALVTLQEVENSNIRGTLSLMTGKQKKLEEDNLYLTEGIEKVLLELNAHQILVTALRCEYSDLKEGQSFLENKCQKFQEEKGHLVEENNRLLGELLAFQERMSTEQVERTRLTVDLEEVMVRLDKLTEENTLLSSSLEVHKAKMREIADRDAQGLINHEMAVDISGSSEIQVCGHGNAAVLDRAWQSLETQYDKVPQHSEEIFDNSSDFSELKEQLEKGEKILQNLERVIEQIHTHSSSLYKSSSKVVMPGVSKLIQAFESKLQHEEQESEETPLTGDQSEMDPFASVNVYIRNLRAVLEQLVLNTRHASMKFKGAHDDAIAANEKLNEIDVQFKYLQEHSNLLEADNIENKILFEAAKQYSYELQAKHCGLEDLCESLKLQNDRLSVENAELNKKLDLCLSRINGIETQLESLQQNLSHMASSVQVQLEGLRDESEKAMMLEHELISSISEMDETVGRLDDYLLRFYPSCGDHVGLDINKHITDSVYVALKVINDLETKVEAACAKHESSSNSYEELKESFNILLEKNELATAILHKVYADLRKLVTESSGSAETPDPEMHSPAMPDPLNYGSYENLVKLLRNFLTERLELQFVNEKLQSELLSKRKDMEELTRQCLGSGSLRKLAEALEGVVELETAGSNFEESPGQYVEFLVSDLVQKFRGTMEQANLFKEQLDSREIELMGIQKNILQHKTDISALRESISLAEESLLAARSELHEKSNELEQSEQRLSSIREKLSIAVAKGKGLVVQRDNLKQSLAETSAELERCSEELKLKEARLQEVEAKLKTHAEAGERVEALESELSYIRNSATALRESFLLKDSLLHRIEEILEDLDLPEHFHARDILEKVEWLARSASGNSLPLPDWDQKSSDGGAGFVITEPWREDVQPSTNSGDDLRIKFEELQGKFYGLAEQNEMLEQSLMLRNNLVQRWEELLEKIHMPPQLRSMEVEDKIEWLGSTISEATHDRDALQQKVDDLENYCRSLTAGLEVSQKQASDVEADRQSVVNERDNLSESLETLKFDHEKLSARIVQIELENEKLQNQVNDLHEKLVEKLGNEEHLQTVEREMMRLRDLINDAVKKDGLQDLTVAGDSETLEGLLRRLIEYYKTSLIPSSAHEADGNFSEASPANPDDIISRDSMVIDGATSDRHGNEATNANLGEATSRDIAATETPDLASLKKELEEALHTLKLAREERDIYMEKQQSLVAEVEALDKKRMELQELLNQEEQKSASVREKLNVAVRKGKSLVQQRDSLKQTIEEMTTELGRLKSEINNREEMLAEYEKKIRELVPYPERAEALDSECESLKIHLKETENLLQERSSTLNMTLSVLSSIDIGDEGDSHDPVWKLQRISKRLQDMCTAAASAEQESRKSRRAAELLLAELNEVQERNDSLQEELSKSAYEVHQLSRQKDAAEAAKVEALSHLEKLSMMQIEERRKQYSELMTLRTSMNTLRNLFASINNCLADVFSKDLEFVHQLEANLESFAKQTDTSLGGSLFLSSMTGNFVHKENFSPSSAWSDVSLHDISSDRDIAEICGSLAQNLHEFMTDVSALQENISKHLVSWHEQVNIAFEVMDTFFKSLGKGKDLEIASLREKIALLHGACSNAFVEIESKKAELVGHGDLNTSLNDAKRTDGVSSGGGDDLSSMESVRSMVDRLSLAVKDFVIVNAEMVERNQKDTKTIIANLQRELQEKDIQKDRMCTELVGQIKEAQASARNYAADLQSVRARMHDMENRLEILVGERDSLEERVKELQDGQASSAELQKKVKSFGDLLAAKEQEIEALMQALDEEETQMEDLKSKVEELEREVERKNLDLQNAEASRGKIAKKLSVTVSRFDELHRLSENLLTEVEKLQQQLQERDAEISFLRQEVTRSTNEVLVASQMSTKRDSDEIKGVLSWFDAIALLVGLQDSSSYDSGNQVHRYMEVLEKKIASMISELDELRLMGQSKDALLEAERSRVAELRQRGETLEKMLHEKESQANMPTSLVSEIVEVEPVINKWTVSGTSIPSQVRSLRKGNNDQVAIAIDSDQADHGSSLEEDDDKAHGFKSLSTSRIVPRFTRPVTDMIDGLWVSCDRTLMRQPALRLGIMIYWAILHALLATFVV